MTDFNQIIEAIDAASEFAGDYRPLLQKEFRLARDYIAEVEADPNKRDAIKIDHIATLLQETADAMDEGGFGLLSSEVSRAASQVADLDSEDEDD